MLGAVANRFPFPESELVRMKLHRLAFWYGVHEVMSEDEQRRMGALTGGK